MSLNKIAVVRFLREETPKGLANIVAMSAVSGITGAAILGIITLAALAHSAVGPIDLTIERGEIVFIVGGNGSGKTTLLKLLTGLYHPKTGLLKVDWKRVDASNRRAFRELFAGVQSDFFLFNRLYGVEQIDEDLARDLLKKMEMTHKVQIVDGRFSTLDLST